MSCPLQGWAGDPGGEGGFGGAAAAVDSGVGVQALLGEEELAAGEAAEVEALLVVLGVAPQAVGRKQRVAAQLEPNSVSVNARFSE